MDSTLRGKRLTKERGQRLNLDFLQEMSGGDNEFVIEILEIFISDAPLTLDSIKKGIEESDFASVKTSVHKLKSSIKVLGEEQLAILAQQLEDESESKNKSEDFNLRIAKLEKSVEQLVKDADLQVKYLKTQH